MLSLYGMQLIQVFENYVVRMLKVRYTLLTNF